MERISFAVFVVFSLIIPPSVVSAQAFNGLLIACAGEKNISVQEIPSVAGVPAPVFVEARQYLPPNNNEPGFEWPSDNRDKLDEDFFYTGRAATFLKVSPDLAEDLSDGTGKCALAANTRYKAAAKPGFEGEHMTVALAEPLPGCKFIRGYIYMTHVLSSSAGGAWELPRTVRAFMDTLAFAEGTKDRYNYIFTFVTFNSYADHPRRPICAGSLCSTAAGRYQFLAKTWDGLAPDMGISDFTPPSQDKAGLELVRRAGAYNLVLKSNTYANFSAAVRKLNMIWASLPGSPYGQPTHSMSALWKAYKVQLAKY
ncbi:MAG TPA: hypothetical protein DCL44_02865 [Elusimicrobia bacterium]|nr:hypothetical protein [Elusimicrobiota bacterium]